MPVLTADPVRRRRLRRWGRGVLALALLALVGLGIAFQPAIHWIAERELTRALDARVRIDRLRIFPFTGRLHATDVWVRDKQGGQPLLYIPGLEIEVRLGALWQRELLVTRLGLDQPEVWMALTPDGFAWLPLASTTGASPHLAVTLQEVVVQGGRIHVADRRRSPEHREIVEDLEVRVRDLSTRDDRREVRETLRLRGRWRRMTVSADGWVAPFARRRAFHLPVRIAHADLGQVAGILPPGLAPPGLTGEAEVGVDVKGQEAGGEWQVQAGVQIEARRVTARPRPDLAVQGASLRLRGQAHWSPKVIGFSQLSLDVAGATIEVGGRLRASMDRLGVRGQADLDHRGLLVPEMAMEATGLSLGQIGQPPTVRIGRIAVAGGTDQRAGTARLERVSLADVDVRALRQADGSLDVAGWMGGAGLPVAEGGGERPLYWEILRLEVERAGLDLTDRGTRPERTLAIRDVSLRVAGATSDPTQPITFDLTASTSVARAIRLSGTWLRSPVQLQAKAAIEAVDLPGLRAWLPATLPVEILSGQASLTLQADVRRDQNGLAASGTAGLALHDIRVQAEPGGAFVAEDIEVALGQIKAAGPGLAGLALEAVGRVRGKAVHARLGDGARPAIAEASLGELQVTLGRIRLTPQPGGVHALTIRGSAALGGLQARASGYGVDSLAAQAVRADSVALTTRLGPGGGRLDLRGGVSLTGIEGSSPGLPIRTWKAAGIQMDVGQLHLAPFRLHLRRLEVDRPEVQAVRAEDVASTPGSGLGWSPPPAIRLDRMVIRNGRIAFRDEMVRPVWSGEFTEVEAVVGELQTDTDAPASFRLSLKEAEGAQARLSGRVQPVTWSGEVRAELENLDVLRPGAYLPDLVHRVVRGGTASGALDVSLRQAGQALHVTGKGDLTFAPLELGDARRDLTLLLAEKVQVQVEQLSLDPLVVRVSAVRMEQPWIGVGRDEDGSVPALRLVNELRQPGGGPPLAGGAPVVTVGVLTLSDGTAEIEDRAVQPRFRDQVRNLELVIEDLTTEEDRKASVALTGELSDRSAVALHGFILPLPTNLYVDLEGQVRDLNLHRLNSYTARVTSYRLEQGKLFGQVRYRVEQDRLEGENLFRIDQLALGEQVEPVDRFEALVGVPLALAISLLQDSSGEIILRVPVHGELNHPEFDLGEVIAAAIRNTLMQLVTAPFRLIGQIFTLGGRIGAIEINPVLFAPGSWALDDAAREHLRNIVAVLRDRPTMKVKLSGMAHVESDEDGLRARKVEAELLRIVREPGVKGRDDALDRLFLRTFGASAGVATREAKLARLKTAQKLTARDVEDLPDARTLAIYDYLAGEEKIERDRMFLAEGKIYRTAEGGGDWARRADFTVLQP
ncbi:MAG: hypothetical protein A3G35_00610 [candidate division NC10 bacterium RIFCSPLOWO2_12_FULL_66_18]|nr:MAG: hypothetical protein A3G35_00610 [candidate division NC10 bacterium RIFCSPLOWO2_12_FULL_66_18]